MNIFDFLHDMTARPEPYSEYTAEKMWNDPHVSASMLALHLDGNTALASRPTEFIERSVQWIDETVGLSGKRVCDFGCGPGLYANRFAMRGARVTGLDFSRRSLDHARTTAEELGLDVDYRYANYLNFYPDEKYDLITLIYGDFCALSPEQRSKLLAIWRNCLADNGKVLLDVFSTEHLRDVTEGTEYCCNQGGFWSPDEHYEFRTSFLYEELDLALFHHVVVEQARIMDIFNWMHYYTPESLARELADNGFSIEAHYADLTGAPAGNNDREIAVLLTPTS